ADRGRVADYHVAGWDGRLEPNHSLILSASHLWTAGRGRGFASPRAEIRAGSRCKRSATHHARARTKGNSDRYRLWNVSTFSCRTCDRRNVGLDSWPIDKSSNTKRRTYACRSIRGHPRNRPSRSNGGASLPASGYASLGMPAHGTHDSVCGSRI